ncbi:MAG: hypothetical protein ACREHD_05095 [Pirellulales bacterium]
MALLVAASGCHQSATLSEGAEHRPEAASHADEEERPITSGDVPIPANYAEAVERLCQYRDAIREAVATKQPAKAHRPLDETNIALERLPALARSSGVPRRDWETVVVAGDDLGEALGAIHEMIDANQLPDYAMHAKTIDDALARLQAAAKEREQSSLEKNHE